MPENFASMSEGLESPLSRSFAIDPASAETLPRTTRAIYIGGSGNAVVRFAGDGADRTLNGLVAGTVMPFRLTAVRNSGTTATGLVGLD